MASAQARYICTACGGLRKKYKSRCPFCDRYLTLISIGEAREEGFALPLGKGESFGKRPHYMTTSIDGLDDIASGHGLVQGICYLVTGGPGAGKSTMLIQVAAHLGRKRRVAYAFLEPGEDFVEMVGARLGLDMHRIRGVSAESMDELIARTAGADVVILDSLQGLAQRSEDSVDDIAHKLALHAHATKSTWILVGHINKEGDPTGVMAIEHWVDTTIHLSPEHGRGLRVLSCGKNRYGPERVRFLQMTEDKGLVDVPDASSYLLADRSPGEVGSCVAAVLVHGWKGAAARPGVAPVLVEVQALTSRIGVRDNGKLDHSPRVTVSGLPADRARLVLEVLSQKAGVDVSDYDVTVNVCGSLEVDDRSLEAPMALAVTSAIRQVPLPQDLCAWGEIDLVGRIRGLASTKDRVEEAKKAKFTRIAHEGRLADVLGAVLIGVESTGSSRHTRDRAGPGKAVDARKRDARRPHSVRVPAVARGMRAEGAGGRVSVPVAPRRAAGKTRPRRRK